MEETVDSVKLIRKYGLSTARNRRKVKWLKQLNGGVFQASNDASFKEATTLFKISDFFSTHTQKMRVNSNQPYQFVRFSSEGNEAFLAKLAFYGMDGIELKGSTIKENNWDLIWETGAYDDNPLSFSGGTDFKLGLHLEKPQNIGTIEFQARNDDNHINIGETYELFYWNKVWISLGTQTANDTVLYYNVPKNALLWLRNITKGKEEYPFIVDKHKNQIWLGFDNY
jgi:hypothetical protein